MIRALEEDDFARAILGADLEAIRGHVSSAGDADGPTLRDADNRGWKPLELATRCAVDNPSEAASNILELLIDAASPEPEAYALMRAAGNNCPKVVYPLLKAGADATLEHAKYNETARQLASGLSREILERAEGGDIVSPFDLVDLESVRNELHGWAAGIAAFAPEHRDETFYAVALDAGTLKTNSDESFARTLEEYSTGDEDWRQAYRDRDERTVQGLRYSVGDWVHRIPAGESEGNQALGLTFAALERRPDDDRLATEVIVALMVENADRIFADLQRSADFRVYVPGHRH